MSEKILVVGSGGHARSVMDIIIRHGLYEIIGCIDNIYGTVETVPGMDDIQIIGNDSMLPDLFSDDLFRIFIALGSNKLRDKIFNMAISIGYEPVNVISPDAVISPRVKLGKGICVMAGAVINVNTCVGDNTIINTHCSVDHDCCIGKSVHIAPGVAISGYVEIGDISQIGTGASVIDRIKIGKNVMIGGGAAVISNIPSDCTAVGVPAKILKKLEV